MCRLMVAAHCAGIEVTKVGYAKSSLYRSSVVMLSAWCY